MSTQDASLILESHLTRLTYHALLTTLFTVRALDVENEDVSLAVESHPNTFGGLRAAHVLVHNIKL
jgi:hypothetical protein